MSIPKQIKHATIAIMDKINPSPINGDFIHSKFLNGWKIALSKAMQYGYVYMDTSHGSSYEQSLKLTTKGQEKEIEHLKDTSNRAVLFDLYFTKYGGTL